MIECGEATQNIYDVTTSLSEMVATCTSYDYQFVSTQTPVLRASTEDLRRSKLEKILKRKQSASSNSDENEASRMERDADETQIFECGTVCNIYRVFSCVILD